MARNICWLHISDLHSRGPKTGWDSERVIESLQQDLSILFDDHGVQPHLVFFTGDAVFGHIGKAPGSRSKQFQEAEKVFEAIRNVYNPSIPKERFFLVPGNHDVNRERVTPDQNKWLDDQNDIQAINEFVESGTLQWERQMERLRDYRKFLQRNEYTHLLTNKDSLIYGIVANIEGMRIGIAGLNSAWSCGRDRERGKLWLGVHRQVESVISSLVESEIRIALIHHPTNWLVEHEVISASQILQRDFDFVLNGHDHTEWVEPLADGHTRIATAAFYDRSDVNNGYNVVEVDLDASNAKVWLRKYDPVGGGWVPRVIKGKTNDGGIWELKSIRSKQRPPSATSIVPQPINPPLIIRENLGEDKNPNREKSDREKLLECMPQLIALVGDMADFLRSEALSGASGPKIANALSLTALHRIQRAFQDYSHGSICCLKIAVSEDLLRCYYPPQTLSHERAFDHVSIEESYSGLALQNNEHIIIPDLSVEQNRIQSPELLASLQKSNVRGLAVWPINIRMPVASTAMDRSKPIADRSKPIAVFKVDFPVVNGLVNNQPTRWLLDFTSKCFALAFQQGLAASTLSFEEFFNMESADEK